MDEGQTKTFGELASLVAIDIGNTRIKFGRFLSTTVENGAHTRVDRIPKPDVELELLIDHETGQYDKARLVQWCEKYLTPRAQWSVGSVHRKASDMLSAHLTSRANELGFDWPIRQLTYHDIPLPIRVDEPARVGIDRLLAAVAANKLRTSDRAAIVIDLGTAITVDLVEADGAFAGGAILPGIGMASRALADQTDALPHVVLEQSAVPAPLGKSTKAAIEAGLYWGAVGAVGKLVSQLSAGLPTSPEIFVTGGAAGVIAESIQGNAHVQHVPHLVLSGIALVEQMKDKG